MRKTFILIFLIGVLLMSCSKDQKVAVISTKFGDMVVEFFPDVAPMHVENFQILAEEGYYNGTTFHRVIPGFMIQGGDPNSKDLDRMNDGTGGRAGKFFGIGRENDPESWTVPAEFNDTPHQRGTLSMARSQNIDSGSSQFFICHDNAPFLDGQYTVFGQLISGIEVVDEIVNSERDPRDNPIDRVEMTVSLVDKSEAIKNENN
jgi:cyclophilin family peptidyl-prolyl cis-trans isomerase